jgi:hypothetical protein
MSQYNTSTAEYTPSWSDGTVGQGRRKRKMNPNYIIIPIFAAPVLGCSTD